MRFFVRADGTWRGGTALGLIAIVVCGVSLVGASFGGAPPPLELATSGLSNISGNIILSAARPVRVVIGSLGVDAPVESVDVDGDGLLQPPSLKDPKTVGWYRRSPTPGENGNAVLVGHVDTEASGPAVFYELGRVKPGERVEVRREDGSSAVFRVDSVRLFPKSGFPAALVYGPTPDARLQLVTCGGTFDRRRGGYLGNTVVTASLAEAGRPGPG